VPAPTSEAVAAIADNYRKRGYAITLDPTEELMPTGVESYLPDFIAIRNDEKVAVEVKSRDSLGADPKLMRLAQQFRRVPGWRLDVAVVADTEPRRRPEVLTRAEIEHRLETADRVAAESRDYASALLLLWTAIEAVLHSRLENGKDQPVSPNRLAKLAYSLGLVSDDSVPLMEWLVRVRNDVVHGREATGVSEETYRHARELATRIVRFDEEPKDLDA
jgi:hypothetical protein